MKNLSILLSGDFATSIFGILVVLGVAIVIFLALRSVALWYWKIETIISELKMINKNLTIMIEKEDGQKEKKEKGS